MLCSVLRQLEILGGELAAIDPEGRIAAADRVAELAVRLRATLAREEVDEGQVPDSGPGLKSVA